MKEFFLNFRKKITTAYIAKTAILTALSFILYYLCKFNLPFMFPSFLEMQFSELPAILAGFSMGTFSGAMVIILKCLFKFPLSSTMFVGEIMDIILGLAYVIPASIIYNRNKTKKNAILGLIIGITISTCFAMLFNRIIAIPFYVKLFFGNNFSAIVGMCSSLYPGLTENNFYVFYIFVAVLPFNLLRLMVVSLITFFVYKRISKILHWEIKSKIIKETSGNVEEYINSDKPQITENTNNINKE